MNPVPFVSVLAVLCLAAAGPQPFDIEWFTIDGGGGTSVGGGFELAGTIGQPDAGPALAGGGFELTGGFWPGTSARAAGSGDCDGDGDVDLDDYAGFPDCMTGPVIGPLPPGCECLDLNASGRVELGDYAEFQVVFGSAG